MPCFTLPREVFQVLVKLPVSPSITLKHSDSPRVCVLPRTSPLLTHDSTPNIAPTTSHSPYHPIPPRRPPLNAPGTQPPPPSIPSKTDNTPPYAPPHKGNHAYPRTASSHAMLQSYSPSLAWILGK